MRRLLALLAAATLAAASAAVATVALQVATPAPALALDNGLALTPPMGFNNWNTTHCSATFNETMVKGIADKFVSAGLKDVGYQYVNIDDCWAKPARDSNGNLVPDPVRFPNGIKAVADYVHSKGLKFGIYTSAGTKTCDTLGFPGGLGHEQQDANLFASWGVDYLKYDNCNNQGVDAQQRYKAMRDALAATGRPIVYSICEWGDNAPWDWAQSVGNLWRTTGDISDNWSSMIGKAHANSTHANAAGPGAWNDPDMLEVGNGGMTDTEYRTHFSLWSVMAAPLLIGSDIRNASAATLAILKNTDVIAVDQDSLGKQGIVVSNSGGLYVYSKQLANGDRAVALTNENAGTQTISTTASAIGLGGSSTYTLKELWSKAVTTTSGSISASVPAHGTVMFRVTPGPLNPPPAGTSYLSNLQWSSAANGWGPVEKDMSVGEQAAGDGRTLTINGTTYAKGLGVHALSEVRYHLGGNCSTVVADVGVDDEKTGAGSVVFQIWRDSTKVADSGTKTYTQAATRLTANVTGGTTLRLVVTDNGDGVNSDHADWANAQLTCAGGSATTMVEAESANRSGAAVAAGCGACSGGSKVGYIGNGAANYVTFANVNATSSGSRQLTLAYLLSGTRSFYVSVNGGPGVVVTLTGTSWSAVVNTAITISLNAGNNTIKIYNDTAYAPDLDKITIA